MSQNDRGGRREEMHPRRSRPSAALADADWEGTREKLALSTREFEIALLILDGYTGKQIAKALSSSPHTVGSHVRRIFRKLGVTNRASIVARLFEAAVEDGRT